MAAHDDRPHHSDQHVTIQCDRSGGQRGVWLDKCLLWTLSIELALFKQLCKKASDLQFIKLKQSRELSKERVHLSFCNFFHINKGSEIIFLVMLQCKN